ncbi:MAG TPA: hypothetical protein VK177_20445 [Flavobacteriales bacterium]|nr:hypothetical protein [Flavobacteriales bacterium]
MYKHIVLFTFIILGFGYKVLAQKDSIVITGFIKDSMSGGEIPFVDVFFDMDYHPTLKPKYKAQSDFDGFFRMKIARADLATGVHKLFFRFVGYEMNPQIVSVRSANSPLLIHAKQAGVMLEHNDPIEYVPKKE